MTTERPAIVSRALLLRFVSVVAGAVGFYLPLSAVPLFAEAGGSSAAAGLANGALLVATVIGELATPRLVARIGYRWALGVGLALLGAPALLLLTCSALPLVVAVNAARGLGFAITVVAGGALTAALIPAERRGEGLALVGLVGGVPSLIALPLGAWAAAHWGFGVVFVLTAAFPLAAIATVPGLPSRTAGAAAPHGVVAGLRRRDLRRPAAIFAGCAAATGVIVTFVPLAVGARAGWAVPAALFLQPTAATLGRWVAGRVGDRLGQSGLLVPGVALSIVGMAGVAVTVSPVVVVAGATVAGAGFGVLQNATLSLMYSRVDRDGYSAVSALWNGGYDLGMAAGALGVGVLVGVTGLPFAFAVVAAAMLPALAAARRDAAPRQEPARVGAPALV